MTFSVYEVVRVAYLGCVTERIQLFRERLSEKAHANLPKGIVGGFEKEVWKSDTRGHGRMFKSAKGKQQK